MSEPENGKETQNMLFVLLAIIPGLIVWTLLIGNIEIPLTYKQVFIISYGLLYIPFSIRIITPQKIHFSLWLSYSFFSGASIFLSVYMIAALLALLLFTTHNYLFATASFGVALPVGISAVFIIFKKHSKNKGAERQ